MAGNDRDTDDGGAGGPSGGGGGGAFGRLGLTAVAEEEEMLLCSDLKEKKSIDTKKKHFSITPFSNYHQHHLLSHWS